MRRAAASVLSAVHASPAAPLGRAAGVWPAAFGPSLGRGFAKRAMKSTEPKPPRQRGPKPVYDIPVPHPPPQSPHFLSVLLRSPHGVKRRVLCPAHTLMSVRVPHTRRRSRPPRRESWHRRLSSISPPSPPTSHHGTDPQYVLDVTHPALIPASTASVWLVSC